MAAFWGFLTALICVACFVAGAVFGYLIKGEAFDRKPKYVPDYNHDTYTFKTYWADKLFETIEEIKSSADFYERSKSEGFTEFIYNQIEDSIRKIGSTKTEEYASVIVGHKAAADLRSTKDLTKFYVKHHKYGNEYILVSILSARKSGVEEINEGDYYSGYYGDRPYQELYYNQITGQAFDNDDISVDIKDFFRDNRSCLINLDTTKEEILYYYDFDRETYYEIRIDNNMEDKTDGDTDNQTPGD